MRSGTLKISPRTGHAESYCHSGKKGDKLVCSNHRGVTFLSIPGKVFTRVLLSRSLPAIRRYRRPQQAGFMPNRSTIDHISDLRLIIEKTPKFRKGRHLYIAFIDLKAAFDSVDHASLWAILACTGVLGKILRLFKKLYGDSQSCIRINGKLSEWFNINSGVRQGCVAAPGSFQLPCWSSYVTGLCTDPGRVFRQPPSCWPRIRWRHHSVVQWHCQTHGCPFSLR